MLTVDDLRDEVADVINESVNSLKDGTHTEEEVFNSLKDIIKSKEEFKLCIKLIIKRLPEWQANYVSDELDILLEKYYLVQ